MRSWRWEPAKYWANLCIPIREALAGGALRGLKCTQVRMESSRESLISTFSKIKARTVVYWINLWTLITQLIAFNASRLLRLIKERILAPSTTPSHPLRSTFPSKRPSLRIRTSTTRPCHHLLTLLRRVSKKSTRNSTSVERPMQMPNKINCRCQCKSPVPKKEAP